MEGTLSKIKEIMEKMALRIVTLDEGEINQLGEVLNSIDKISELAVGEEFANFIKVLKALRGYVENAILQEETDMEPVEEGMELLQAMWRSINNGKDFTFEYGDILQRLDCETINDRAESEEYAEASSPVAVDSGNSGEKLNEEDLQILGDFVIEAKENLESIEINLINLEQEPDDKEIINAIFRPFHTIKGVSGFLDLKKINSLSHSTENLLDSARQGMFVIDNALTDLILGAVDILKRLIDCVEVGLEEGVHGDDRGIEVDSVITQIDGVLTRSEQKGGNLLGDILVEKGVIDNEELEDALTIQGNSNPEAKLGEILVDEKNVESKEVISALREQKRSRKVSSPQVKVDTSKLDNLVDLTGELVIAQSMLKQKNLSGTVQEQKFAQNLNHFGQIVSNVQKIAMSMRMVPINSTFQKMVRLVRDLARNSGKEVSLEMVGEDTEIDRNVVEALYEPMVHMIRNSADHGIESPDERVASGKDRSGTINLRAYHKGGNIVIEIEDDGKGLSKEKIFEKAVSSGLVKQDAVMTDREIFDLIMQPGFSTAKEVTDVSGRGVGMDVVKKAIEDLRGTLDIESNIGMGTRVIITLPLTLAIIEGMLIRVGLERFIVPTMAIVESFKPREEDYYTVENKGEMVMVRDSLVPVIRLDRVCDTSADAQKPWDGLIVVVENKDEQRGLLLDELLGKDEFVIKSLGETFNEVKGLAGGAILGDGTVGLILDMAGLYEVAGEYA